MATDHWRALATQHLPQYRQLIASASSEVDLWQLLKEVVADWGGDARERELVAPIFEYAWWCVNDSQLPEIACAVRTCFWEDLPAYSDTASKIAQFLTEVRFRQLRDSLGARVDSATLRRLFPDWEFPTSD